MMAQFCYSTPYLDIETVSCCLLQRMVRMGIQKIETNAMPAFCVWVDLKQQYHSDIAPLKGLVFSDRCKIRER